MDFFIHLRLNGHKEAKMPKQGVKAYRDHIVAFSDEDRKQDFFSISLEEHSYSFSKFIVYYDHIRGGDGFIQFGLNFPKNEKIRDVKKIITFFNHCYEYFKEFYLDKDFISKKDEFVVDDFEKIFEQYQFQNDIVSQKGESHPSFDHGIRKIYCTPSEIESIFSAPFFNEFYEFQQIFLLDQGIKHSNYFYKIKELDNFELDFSTYSIHSHEIFTVFPLKNEYKKSDIVSFQLKDHLTKFYEIPMELSQQITQCRISELIAKQYLIKNGESYSINISKNRLRKKTKELTIKWSQKSSTQSIVLSNQTETSKPVRNGQKLIFEGEQINKTWDIEPKNKFSIQGINPSLEGKDLELKIFNTTTKPGPGKGGKKGKGINMYVILLFIFAISFLVFISYKYDLIPIKQGHEPEKIANSDPANGKNQPVNGTNGNDSAENKKKAEEKKAEEKKAEEKKAEEKKAEEKKAEEKKAEEKKAEEKKAEEKKAEEKKAEEKKAEEKKAEKTEKVAPKAEKQGNNLEKTESLLEQVKAGKTPQKLDEWAVGKKLSKEENKVIIKINEMHNKNSKWPIWKDKNKVKNVTNLSNLIIELKEQ